MSKERQPFSEKTLRYKFLRQHVVEGNRLKEGLESGRYVEIPDFSDLYPDVGRPLGWFVDSQTGIKYKRIYIWSLWSELYINIMTSLESYSEDALWDAARPYFAGYQRDHNTESELHQLTLPL